MKKGLKITLIVVGAVLGAVAVDVGVSLVVNAATKVETTHKLKGKTFNSIDINVGTADVYLKEYQGSDPYVKCIETSYAKHDVKVEGNTLKIKSDRKENFPFLIVSPKRQLEVYIPVKTEYKLNIYRSTGDVFIGENFKFNYGVIKGSTGDLSISNSFVSNKLSVIQSTGDVNFNDINANSVDIDLSTGNIALEKVKSATDLKLKTSTGHHFLDNCNANKLIIKSSTGDVKIKNSDANEIDIKTSTGDVTAEFRTSKIVYAKSSTGEVNVPKSKNGGLCSIETSTGDVTVTFKK